MSETDLASKHCVPCSGGVPKLWGLQLEHYAKQVPEWKVDSEHHLERTFKFPDFKSALAFTNNVGEVAEAEGHHPDIALSWGKVTVTIWTHKIDGLSEADFVLAAKISRL
ncbi:MAG: 4a-hydroxytetrahydrobiopterin dehydratase [Deltaproteobacteria bacterium]|nr:4a-hydroxytetrahydrobiopterin dehydratase [Deltaproteobacteria bacterium]